MAKDSAFAGLKLSRQSGVDQRLFQAKTDNVTTKQRNLKTTPPRDNETSQPPDIETTRQPVSEAALERASEDAGNRSREVSTGGQPLREARLTERHSHDIYHDQVRWLNRVKLALEERYTRRVTGNAIVAVAIDALRLDYEKRGEASDLVRAAVYGKSLETPKKGGGR